MPREELGSLYLGLLCVVVPYPGAMHRRDRVLGFFCHHMHLGNGKIMPDARVVGAG